ncbi:hypothetical protein PHAVU_003G138300 [Phaseolus vulgaris]|uniref:Uncharacterized protein n=1 Tax=Phaseolus vulgaris TaxID=3885 RepID=V7CBF7_PHAVU|nr:hypothetical protein PHAVU_003G138300g [Phaseolus vulgaris]ESW26668.1 hypothetical protein PHAVU_003G138300g [Phaseolus vulgaris]
MFWNARGIANLETKNYIREKMSVCNYQLLQEKRIMDFSLGQGYYKPGFWAILGDFNAILSVEEKQRDMRAHRISTEDFQN